MVDDCVTKTWGSKEYVSVEYKHCHIFWGVSHKIFNHIPSPQKIKRKQVDAEKTPQKK